MKSPKQAKTIRDHWKVICNQLSYRLDQIFAGGSLGQFVLLIIVTGIIILLGMSAYFVGLFDPANNEVIGIDRKVDSGLFDTMWWSAKHIFDPSFFYANYGATWPLLLVSLFMAVMGMSLFATLLGFISSGIEHRMAELRKGNSAVMETGHILILGWNDKIFSILQLLEERNIKVKVVILSEYTIEQMNEFLRIRGQQYRCVKIILRTGSPRSQVELLRVGYRDAFSIMVLGDESSPDINEAVDMRVIKTLMLLANNQDWATVQPKMVAEIIDKENLQVAEIAADNKISIICSSQIISKMIVQSSRQPGLSRVYSELFGFAGNEIYVRGFPEAAGRRFNDVRAGFKNAVPIGVSRTRKEGDRFVFEPCINPGKDYVIQPDEWIICIAPDSQITFDSTAKSHASTFVVTKQALESKFDQILVFGWNDQLYDILNEIDSYMTSEATIRIVAAHAAPHALALIDENLSKPLSYLKIDYEKADYAKQSTLAKLSVDKISQLIILADESSNELDPDSRTMMTLLSLRTLLTDVPVQSRARVVAEVVNADNCDLLQVEKNLEFIISPGIISMLLTQICLQLMLKAVYEDLLSAGGNEIYLKPVSRYAANPSQTTFGDIAAGAAERNEVAIGYYVTGENRDSNSGFGVHINPDAGKALALDDKDKVIVIALDLYDPE